MSNNLFQFNFQDDQQEKENSYPISDVQWIYINDINQGNYSNAYVNFTNVSVIGSNVEKQYLWSQGYLTIPYTITVLATNLQFTTDDANVNALSIKSYATFVDWLSIKYYGVSCSRNSYFNHLVMNERIKSYNTDKYKLYGDILCHAWDTGLGISYSSTIGERNNNTLPTNLTTGSNPANTSLRETGNQNALVYQGTDGLVFQGTAIIPLSELHDFFKNMPSVASSSGFELRLQMNVGRKTLIQLDLLLKLDLMH